MYAECMGISIDYTIFLGGSVTNPIPDHAESYLQCLFAIILTLDPYAVLLHRTVIQRPASTARAIAAVRCIVGTILALFLVLSN